MLRIVISDLDHAKSVKDFERMGIPAYKPYESQEPMSFKSGSQFAVQSFDLTDLNGNFKHTNADGTECPCYGFLITHPEMGRMVYITDTELVKWRFKNINHVLISCDYQKKYMGEDNIGKKTHVLRGHMELETVKGFISANKSNALRNVILCHMSDSNSNPEECVKEIREVAGNGVDVRYAYSGLEIELRESDCPF